LLSIAASIIFIVVIPTHIHSILVFTEVMALGSISYAVLFTTMSAIALKAKSNNTLVAVLGFPILIPMLIFITKVTSAALGDITMQELVTKNLLLLIALDIVQIILAIVLFPYIWRE
jgi:heme exporter protein B